MTIRVLVIDDSALVRQLLSNILAAHPDIDVVGTAADPYIAREKIKSLQPDVLTLDVEMPGMDGLTFLERLMALHPMPVVVLSTLTTRGADVALRALQLGAIDYVAKPQANLRGGLAELESELVAKIKAASLARPAATSKRIAATSTATNADQQACRNTVVAIGSSTGGVEALHALLADIPKMCPPILTTQHMPAGFTASFARRLDSTCGIHVTEAADGQPVEPGTAYLANGAYHLELARAHDTLVCRLRDGAPVSGHRPSVDVLFASVARTAGRRAVGVILTGMGRDGVNGLSDLRQAGGRTIGQDQATCVVYGMPQAAKAAGAVERELPLGRIAQAIMNATSKLAESVT